MAAPPRAASEEGRSLAIPASERLQFNVLRSRNGVVDEGRGELTWRHDGSSYEALLRGKLADATVSLRSSGLLDASGIRPRTFASSGQGIVATANKASPGRLLEGAEGLLAALIQLRAVLAGAASAPAGGDEIRVELNAGAALAATTFKVDTFETVSVGGRPVETVKLTAVPGAGATTEIWLATSSDYAPVRFRIADGSDSLEYIAATQDP